MKLDLENYILKINNFVDKNLCKQIINELKKTDWKKHTFYNAQTNEYKQLSGEQELEMTFDHIKQNEILMRKLWEAIKEYIDKLDFKWFAGWTGYTGLKFNKYTKNTTMKKHCDHIHDIFPGDPKGVPILSMVGLLNNDFEGGKFIMFENKEIKLKQGDLIIFPSSFLYPHEVTSVTKGVRYSYVSWVY